jgi:hypothetical protein
VLIVGRFTAERKAVLDALREELRKRKYLPILFDFEKARSRNTDETITLIARMARSSLPISLMPKRQEQLIADLGKKVIRPAELKVPERQGRTSLDYLTH